MTPSDPQSVTPNDPLSTLAQHSNDLCLVGKVSRPQGMTNVFERE